MKATPALNRELCDRFGVEPIGFDGERDAMLHAFTGDGSQHMEYLHDRGVFDDLPLTPSSMPSAPTMATSSTNRPQLRTCSPPNTDPKDAHQCKAPCKDVPLTVTSIVRHATSIHAYSRVVTPTDSGYRTTTYGELSVRIKQLANALRGLGITGDQRVATFQWNNQEHLEAYCAVPSMGAVLHTLNIRLTAEQLGYIANHADDTIVIADLSLAPLLANTLPAMS